MSLPSLILMHSKGCYRHELSLWFGHSACHWDWSSPCANHTAFTSRGVYFPLKGTEQYWTWLSRPGPGHSMLLWVLSLELPGLQHSFSKYLTSLSRFCTCSRLKFQSTGHVHCARHLPILSPTPCHHCPASGQSPGWHSEIIVDL